MTGPSPEAIEATARGYSPIGLGDEQRDRIARDAVGRAYPIIRRDVAREIAEYVRYVTDSSKEGEWLADHIESKYGDTK